MGRLASVVAKSILQGETNKRTHDVFLVLGAGRIGQLDAISVTLSCLPLVTESVLWFQYQIDKSSVLAVVVRRPYGLRQ